MRRDRRRPRSVGCAAALALLTLAAAAAGQAADPRADMARAVLDQLAAFRRNDWAAAYAYASAAIQARFGLEAFREMVTGGYAPIARSATASVSHVEVIDAAHGLVEVRVEGEDGETVDALYELVDEQGRWRINGVLTRPVEAATAAAPAGASARLRSAG
jgi:hypothetical protein